MRRPKQDAGHELDEAGLFSDEQFHAGEFIDEMHAPAAAAKPADDRPARQRLELLREEAWLRRQLLDWEDFDERAFGVGAVSVDGSESDI